MYPYTPPPSYMPPPPPPPRKSNRGVVIAVVCTGLFGLLVLIGMVSALGGSGTKPKTAEAAAASTTTTTRPITTTTSRKDALLEWGQTSMPTISLLQGDFDDISSSAGDYDIAGLRSACVSLGTHANQLSRQLPSPDPALTVELKGAADDFVSASSACVTATRSYGTSSMQSTLSYLESGIDHITNATTILNTYESQT